MAHVKFLYVRVKNANQGHRGDPIACVTSVLDGDVLRYAVSTARKVGPLAGAWNEVPKSDTFDKNLARKIALGKLQSPQRLRKDVDGNDVVLWSTVKVTDRTAVGVTKAVFEDLAKAPGTIRHVPTHVRNAAQQWLNDFNTRRETEARVKSDPEFAQYLALKAKFETTEKK